MAETIAWLVALEALFEQPHIEPTLNPPASRAAIDNAETALAEQERLGRTFSFPPSYRLFLSRYDGGYLWVRPPEDKDAIMDEDDPYACDKGWTGGFDGWFFTTGEHGEAHDSLDAYNAPESVLMNHEIDTYWDFESLVVFGGDGGGDILAFDPKLTHNDGEMPIVLCDHETGEIRDISPSFGDLIHSIATCTIPVRLEIKPRFQKRQQ